MPGSFMCQTWWEVRKQSKQTYLWRVAPGVASRRRGVRASCSYSLFTGPLASGSWSGQPQAGGASFMFLQPFHRSREKRIFPAASVNKDGLTRVSSLSFQTPNMNSEQVPLPTQESPECHSHSQVGVGDRLSSSELNKVTLALFLAHS